jgi:N-acetylmuramoyl-L-alanine amidase
LQQTNNRSVKRGEKIYLLENVNAVSVLIECGFLSNHKECEKLSEKEYQKSLSFAIVCGIIEYMKSSSD